jgi:hypothetical protein
MALSSPQLGRCRRVGACLAPIRVVATAAALAFAGGYGTHRTRAAGMLTMSAVRGREFDTQHDCLGILTR